MFEGALLFVSGILLTWPAFVVLILFGIFSENSYSRGWSVFWLLVSSAVAYIMFTPSITLVAMLVPAYVVVGVLWSVRRYKRYATDTVVTIANRGQEYRDTIISRLEPSNMLPTITAWIIIWPFSLIEYTCKDIIKFIEALVIKVFKGVYNKIYESAIASIKPDDKNLPQ